MELTKITKELLAAGWTKDQTPEGFRPWNDFYGGWEYKESVFRKFVFRTPCGMLVKGTKVIDNMFFMGVDWKYIYNNTRGHTRARENKMTAEAVILFFIIFLRREGQTQRFQDRERNIP